MYDKTIYKKNIYKMIIAYIYNIYHASSCDGFGILFPENHFKKFAMGI